MQKPCKDQAVELLWYESALTALCGIDPTQTEAVRYLSQRIESCQVAPAEREYPDRVSEVAHELVHSVLEGARTWDDARRVFISQFDLDCPDDDDHYRLSGDAR